MSYLLLKWLHIVAAMIVVGAHITYGIWIVRASTHPDIQWFILRTIKVIDDRLAMPAFGILLIAGLAMSFITRVWTLSWLIAGQGLFVLLLLAHMLVYRPTLRRMIELLDREGMDSRNYQAAASREAKLGITMVVVMIAIVYLMVVKPTLWT
jgi:uncharacterized membrane protein